MEDNHTYQSESDLSSRLGEGTQSDYMPCPATKAAQETTQEEYSAVQFNCRWQKPGLNQLKPKTAPDWPKQHRDQIQPQIGKESHYR